MTMSEAFPESCQSIGARTRETLIAPGACPMLRELGIRLCGRSEARPGFRFVRPAPGMRQILSCVSGRGLVWVDGRWRILGADQAYITATDAPHAYLADQAIPWILAWVTWDATGADPAPPRVAEVDAQALAGAIDGLQREVIGVRDPALLTQLAWLVDTIARRMTTDPMDPVLVHLWELVAAEPAAPWTLERLAVRSGLHPESLRRRCLARYRRSPMRQVAELRLTRAAALIASGHSRIAEIAAAVGYSDPFAFSTAFRKRFGHPPSRLRSAEHHPRD